jgi:DNA-binding MarR family transcriptional regulator
MTRRPQGPETTGAQKAVKQKVGSVNSAQQGLSSDQEQALSLIRTHPGIRPSELNRLMNKQQSDSLRAALIKRGLIRKEQDGSAMRYYPV